MNFISIIILILFVIGIIGMFIETLYPEWFRNKNKNNLR